LAFESHHALQQRQKSNLEGICEGYKGVIARFFCAPTANPVVFNLSEHRNRQVVNEQNESGGGERLPSNKARWQCTLNLHVIPGRA
jgi:hypothetical protein